MSLINSLLKNIKLENISAQDPVEKLADGYYFCEVSKVDWKQSKSGNDMVAYVFKILENGTSFDNDEVIPQEIPNTKNKSIYVYNVIKDENSLNRALSNMLKFTDADGNSIIDKSFLMSEETIIASLELLNGKRIYVSLQTDKKDAANQWSRIISWENAERIGLKV